MDRTYDYTKYSLTKMKWKMEIIMEILRKFLKAPKKYYLFTFNYPCNLIMFMLHLFITLLGIYFYKVYEIYVKN